VLQQVAGQLSIAGAAIVYSGGSHPSVAANQVQLIVIFGQAGNDMIRLDRSKEPIKIKTEIHGGAGEDTIYGGQGKNEISGDDNNDTIYGGPVNDDLSGGFGQDKL
jgi:Ca2+-binding RTX toxin-like protein